MQQNRMKLVMTKVLEQNDFRYVEFRLIPTYITLIFRYALPLDVKTSLQAAHFSNKDCIGKEIRKGIFKVSCVVQVKMCFV